MHELEMWLWSLKIPLLDANTSSAPTTNVQVELDWVSSLLDTPGGLMSAGACWIHKGAQQPGAVVLFKMFVFSTFTNFLKIQNSFLILCFLQK